MKATYNNCKTLIEANRYEYQDMMDKLALFLLVNLISQEDFVELTGMMKPEPEPPVDQNKGGTASGDATGAEGGAE